MIFNNQIYCKNRPKPVPWRNNSSYSSNNFNSSYARYNSAENDENSESNGMSHNFVGCMSHELWLIKVLSKISSPTPLGGQKRKFSNLYFLVRVHSVTPKRLNQDKRRILEFGTVLYLLYNIKTFIRNNSLSGN